MREGRTAKIILFALPIFVAGFLASCAPLRFSSPAQIVKGIIDPGNPAEGIALTSAMADMALLNFRKRAPVQITGKKSLTLEECRSIALANNLEVQQERLEQLTQAAIAYSHKTKMLPHFLINAELTDRDNPPYSYSEVLGREGVPPGTTGDGVNTWSVGRERTTWRYVLETRWSPTDAALAYFLVKSAKNDSQKHHLLRIRTAQKLIGVVDSSFGKIVALQNAMPMAQKLVAMRKRILERSEKLFETNLYNVEEYHRAKQRLIRSERLLSSIKNELEQQRNILTAAMYLTSEKCVGGDLVAVGELRPIRPVAEICELEALAVKNRPEAYKAGLDYMNSMNDYNRALTRYLPKVTGFWRTTRDKDKHLYNKDWKDVGMFIYFDLLDWYTNVHEASAARFISEKNRREVGIVALGIASQVRGVALKYMDSLDQVSAADRALQSSEKLLQIQRYKTSRDSLQKLMLEETEADVLQDKIERLRSQGESNSIFAELQSALGTNYSEPFI